MAIAIIATKFSGDKSDNTVEEGSRKETGSKDSKVGDIFENFPKYKVFKINFEKNPARRQGGRRWRLKQKNG